MPNAADEGSCQIKVCVLRNVVKLQEAPYCPRVTVIYRALTTNDRLLLQLQIRGIFQNGASIGTGSQKRKPTHETGAFDSYLLRVLKTVFWSWGGEALHHC